MTDAPIEVIETYHDHTVRRVFLPETVVPGRRIGRHVNHDSRSKAYRPERVATPQSVAWKRNSPILDQEDLSSCTGNASDGVLGSDPFTATLPPGFDFTEKTALAIYSLATQLDSYAGTYPPTDTGSDGLSAAKACKQDGWISGYTHALSMDDFLAGMQKGPAIVGTTWKTGQDNCDPDTGLVTFSGTSRGGHEYEAAEVDMTNEIVWCWQSWGLVYGLHNTGKFGYRFTEFEKALADSGDATFFTAINQPAPTPTPTPTPPVPAKTVTVTFTAADAATLEDWAVSPHIFRKSTAASKAWKRGTV